MVDVYFGALTAPSCKQRREEVGRLARQEGGACTPGGCSGTGSSVGRVSICTPVHENARRGTQDLNVPARSRDPCRLTFARTHCLC